MSKLLILEIEGEIRSERVVYGGSSIKEEVERWHQLYALKAMKREFKIYYHIASNMESTTFYHRTPKPINYEASETVGECQC